MKTTIISAFLIVLSLTRVAGAQTKISGTARSAKPDKEYSIDVGDRPNHSFSISQSRWTWSKPWEIAGIQSKDEVGTAFGETSGNTSQFRGFYIDSMANEDKAYYRYEGTTTIKDGVPQSSEAKWTIVGGTGKLKGIKGRGTCKLASAAADGGATWLCKGEYELTIN